MPQKYLKKKELISGDIEIKDQQFAMGIAYAIFEEQDESMGVCTTCKSDNHSGPGKYCCVPINMSVGGGACTNCYAKGMATLCKHRYGKS